MSAIEARAAFDPCRRLLARLLLAAQPPAACANVNTCARALDLRAPREDESIGSVRRNDERAQSVEGGKKEKKLSQTRRSKVYLLVDMAARARLRARARSFSSAAPFCARARARMLLAIAAAAVAILTASARVAMLLQSTRSRFSVANRFNDWCVKQLRTSNKERFARKSFVKMKHDANIFCDSNKKSECVAANF